MFNPILENNKQYFNFDLFLFNTIKQMVGINETYRIV